MRITKAEIKNAYSDMHDEGGGYTTLHIVITFLAYMDKEATADISIDQDGFIEYLAANNICSRENADYRIWDAYDAKSRVTEEQLIAWLESELSDSTTITNESAQFLITHLNSAIEDIESGIEAGLYNEEENRENLASMRKALTELQ